MSQFKFEDKPFIIWEEMTREDLLKFCIQLRQEIKILHEELYRALHANEVIVPKTTALCPKCNRIVGNKFKKCRICDADWWTEVLEKRRINRYYKNQHRELQLKLVETGT